jgi:AcrR family transcriptional regulator
MIEDQPQARPAQIRRPRQKRSQERFEAILDAAARVLKDREPGDVSIYTLAEEAEMSPASIYHFFPDAQHVFAALAERYFGIFSEGMNPVSDTPFATWQSLVDFRYEASRCFYNANIAARKIIFGAGSNWTIRARDLELDRELALSAIAQIRHCFVLPEIPGLVDRVTETIVLNDSLWALYNHRYGYLPDHEEEYVRRARFAHMRTYLPEFLVQREIADADAVDDDAAASEAVA